MIVKQKVRSFFIYILFVIIFLKINMMQAQVQDAGILYIGDNSLLYASSDKFSFGLASPVTSRTKLDYGILSFSNGVSWDGANDRYFIDGYVETHSDSAFIFPIGHSDIYAPIQVIPSNSKGVNAAYFRLSPSKVGEALDSTISLISSNEYWEINSTGVNAGISLSWRSSSFISDLTFSSLSNLTVVGWNGSAWVEILSTVDEYSLLGERSSLISGSISSNTAVDLSVYSTFSLGAKSKLPMLPEIDKIELIVYINNNRLFINASLPITALNIYDIMGKNIFSKHLNGDLKYEIPFNYAEEVYIAKIELDNGSSLITKKIINRG